MSKPVKDLSQKILQGWALLAESCPQDNVPLVRSRDGSRILCVACKLNFEISSDGVVPLSEAPSTPSSKSEFSNSLTTSAVAPTPTPNGKQPTNATPQQTLSQQAPSPKPQSPHTSGDGLRSSHTSSEILEEDLKYEYPQSQRKSDQVSKEMGQKLLQGWTLLNDVCPNPSCAVPLMRERGSQRMFCVACQQWVISESDSLAAELQVSAASHGKGAASLASSTPAPPPSEPTPTPSAKPQTPAARPTPAPPVEQSPGLQPAVVSVSTESMTETAHASILAITQTLEAYRQDLLRAASIDERRELIAAMQEAATALLTLRQLA